MHTSATPPEPDLFAGDVALQAVAEFTGRLARDIEVRVRPNGHGHGVPYLVIELDQVGPIGAQIHAEQALTPATRDATCAAAKTLQVGQRVTVRTPLRGHRLVLPDAISISPADDAAAPDLKP